MRFMRRDEYRTDKNSHFTRLYMYMYAFFLNRNYNKYPILISEFTVLRVLALLPFSHDIDKVQCNCKKSDQI